MRKPRSEIFLVCREWRARALVRAQLIEEGFELTALEDLDEAAELLRKRPRKPDVLIYDPAPEGLDGPTLKKLRELASLTKVILCVSASDKTEHDLSQFAMVIARPFYISDLVARVKQLI